MSVCTLHILRRHRPRAGRCGPLLPWVLRCLWWLACAQLLVPALGAMHQVVHPAALHAGLSPQVHAHPAGHAHEPGRADSTLTDLFGEHSDAECRVYDQMALGLAPLPAITPWAPPPPLHLLSWVAQVPLLARAPALFFARGPPGARLV